MPCLAKETMIFPSHSLRGLNTATAGFIIRSNKQTGNTFGFNRLTRDRPCSTLQTKTIASTSNAASNPEASALSRMPTGMFLRSLLISTISSNRILLHPALSILSFISKPNRGFLLNPDKNPLLHLILKKTFYEQFCAGEDGIATKATMQRFKELGFHGVILTYARETVFDSKTNMDYGQGMNTDDVELQKKSNKDNFDVNIDDWTKGTLETVNLIEEGDYLALKYVNK
jgi:hypothetical protein